jgi:hypothetical protein
MVGISLAVTPMDSFDNSSGCEILSDNAKAYAKR